MQRSVRLAAWLAVAGAGVAIAQAFVPIIPSPGGGYTSYVNFQEPALLWGSYVVNNLLIAAVSIGCCFVARSSRRRLAIGAGVMGSLAAFAVRGLIAHLMFSFALLEVTTDQLRPSAWGLWLAFVVYGAAFGTWGVASLVLLRASREPAAPSMPVAPA